MLNVMVNKYISIIYVMAHKYAGIRTGMNTLTGYAARGRIRERAECEHVLFVMVKM